MRILPGSLGTFSGLQTDEHARVLDGQQQPIPGLFAIGNDMSSVMRGYYPSGGITLGPAMTFGYLVGKNLAENTIKQSNKRPGTAIPITIFTCNCTGALYEHAYPIARRADPARCPSPNRCG